MTKKHIKELQEIGLYWDDQWWIDREVDLMKAYGKLLGASLTMHGYQDLVPGLTKECVKIAVDFSLIVRGIDKKIEVRKK